MINKSQAQRGNGLVVFIVIGAVIFLVFLDLFFWNNFLSKDQAVKNTAAPTSTTNKTIETPTVPTKIDKSIHEVSIKMQSSADIKQLPSYTPKSFISYMQSILAANNYVQGKITCSTIKYQYQISKISQVNIQGGVIPVDENGQTCAGGAPNIWVLTPSGTWDQETLNGPVCTSKNGELIFEEFEPECYTDTNTNSFVKNPNGSITSLNK
jgi:hypothetical protein